MNFYFLFQVAAIHLAKHAIVAIRLWLCELVTNLLHFFRFAPTSIPIKNSEIWITCGIHYFRVRVIFHADSSITDFGRTAKPWSGTHPDHLVANWRTPSLLLLVLMVAACLPQKRPQRLQKEVERWYQSGYKCWTIPLPYSRSR